MNITKIKPLIMFSLMLPLAAISKDLLVFGGDNHDEFLGCITCSEYDSSSICNEYGTYGNEYSTDGMFNEYSGYGNEYSSDSPWNEYSTSDSVPVVVDRDGGFYGYFTINEYRSDAFDHSDTLNQIFDNVNGDIEKLRKEYCSILN